MSAGNEKQKMSIEQQRALHWQTVCRDQDTGTARRINAASLLLINYQREPDNEQRESAESKRPRHRSRVANRCFFRCLFSAGGSGTGAECRRRRRCRRRRENLRLNTLISRLSAAGPATPQPRRNATSPPATPPTTSAAAAHRASQRRVSATAAALGGGGARAGLSEHTIGGPAGASRTTS